MVGKALGQVHTKLVFLKLWGSSKGNLEQLNLLFKNNFSLLVNISGKHAFICFCRQQLLMLQSRGVSV